MSDLAGEVVQQLQTLQQAEDMNHPLVLRHACGPSYNEPETLSVKHVAGRKLFVLNVADEELRFESQHLDSAISAFLQACRTSLGHYTRGYATQYSGTIRLHHASNRKDILIFDVLLPKHGTAATAETVATVKEAITIMEVAMQ